ncbi:hypothetical protein TrST_g14237, partial [Triparma strigata]
MSRPRSNSAGGGDVLEFEFAPAKRAPPNSRKGSDRGSSTKKPTPTRPPRSSSSNFSRKSSRINNSDTSDTESSSGGMTRGTAVEARYRGGSRHYPGKISRDNRDGTYDIDYDDGEKEKDVKKSFIKVLSSSSRSKSPRSKDSSSQSYSRGDAVEARYRGGSKYYPGKIHRDNRDGTYDINYDDGEKEKDVKVTLIKALSAGSPRSPRSQIADEELQRGDTVEARYRGGAKFYPGKIARVNNEDSYDIDYDDGEKEKSVKRRLITKVKGRRGLKHSPREEIDFSRGDKVEARYRGGSKYYPGKISRDNRDGTYDIDYDDGEKERGVAKRLINKISGGGGLKHSPRGTSPRGGANDSEDETSFSREDKVEARYRGGSKYYPGKISRDNRDGTYDINYNDGKKEQSVKGKLIKKVISKKKSGRTSKTPKVGNRCTAQFKGKGKFYPGKISKVNSD